MKDKLRLVTMVVIVVCVTACHQTTDSQGARSAAERQRLLELYDSMMNKSPQALEMIEAEKRHANDSLTWYDYHLLYGRHYMLTEWPDSTLPYVEQTLRFTDRAKPTPRTKGLRGTALNVKAAYLYLYHRQPDSITSLFRQAYELMAGSDLKEYLPDICANLGDSYVSTGDLVNASKWYRRALFLTDSLGIPAKRTLSLYMGLGRIYTTLHDFEQAGRYYRMTDQRIDELMPNMQSYFLNNYGNYHYFRKDYQEALRTFRRLQAHIRRYDGEHNFDMYVCNINLADVFLNLGQTDSARHYLQASEAFFKEKGVDVGVYYTQTIHIGIALKEKRYDEVERIIRQGDTLSVTDIDMLSIRKDYLNQYYAAIGDYRRAYEALRIHTTLADSARMERRQIRSADIMTQLAEDTIRLHHQLLLNQQEMEHDKTVNRFAIIVGLLIITILLAIIYLSQQRKRYLQTRLDMLTQRLLNARQRISPHFIFNVLSTHINKAGKHEGDELTRLAHLIRTNLDLTRKTFVTLSEELAFVKEYVDIERSVSGLDFDFAIESPGDDGTLMVRLPSMMVQILTENAMLHGLKGNKEKGRIVIRVEDLGKQVRISVIDNGAGFDIRHYNSNRARTGLNIIRSTVSTVNQENNATKMHFEIKNDHGCHAILTIAKDTKYPIQYEGSNH